MKSPVNVNYVANPTKTDSPYTYDGTLREPVQQELTLRYPISVRIVSLVALTSASFASFSTGHFQPTMGGILAVMGWFVCHFWAYRVRLSAHSVCVETFPFVRRVVPISEITKVVNGWPPMMFSRRRVFRLWGLNRANRKRFFGFLPRSVESHNRWPTRWEPGNRARVYVSRVTMLVPLFLLAIAALFPFGSTGPWSRYWHPVGQGIMVIAFGLFQIVFVTLAVSSNFWGAARDLASSRREKGTGEPQA